ncbi:MAG TPA: hypothetical protein VI408_01780 [Gaiellaceae bacterium]
MPTAESNIRPTEQELVERWRAQELERAGFPEDLAAEFAVRNDVDLHRAIAMVAAGCAPELAADILR